MNATTMLTRYASALGPEPIPNSERITMMRLVGVYGITGRLSRRDTYQAQRLVAAAYTRRYAGQGTR